MYEGLVTAHDEGSSMQLLLATEQTCAEVADAVWFVGVAAGFRPIRTPGL
jgi:hypothetical protein